MRCPETSVRNYHCRPSINLKVCISQSISSPHFMEPEGSLPCLQQLVTCLTPKPDRVHTLPFTPWSSKYLLLHVPHQSFVCIFRLPERTTCSSHSILLKCVTQSLTTYWKFYFKVLPSSMPVSPLFIFHSVFFFFGKCVLLIDYIHLYYMSYSSHTS